MITLQFGSFGYRNTKPEFPYSAPFGFFAHPYRVSSCSPHQRFRRLAKKRFAACSDAVLQPPPSPEPGEARDWLALPQDILLAIFLKLGPCEIIQGAELVCTPWRRAAVEEPLLWRRIDMAPRSKLSGAGGWRAVARAAVVRAAGQCEAFSGFCDYDLLQYLAERAPSLKSLHVSTYLGLNAKLDVALKKLPLLEDLEISLSYLSNSSENLLESVCQACPLLRKLKIGFPSDLYSDGYYGYDDQPTMEEITGIVTTMCELRSLELLDCFLTAEGLTAILDYCPVLESLCITGCFIDEMDAELRAKCSKVKNLSLPVDLDEDDTHEDYEYEIYRNHYW
ncbi:hypothetical protein BS78_07G076300 [Paspalum vaginatum]|nr:hypothetical protein BS78_07G076300 [Paspalum vaginatum]